MQLQGTHLIAGKHTARDKDSFRAQDPRTGQSLPTKFFEATPQDVAAACSAAAEAFPAYVAVSSATRASFLEAIATEIESLGDTLIDRCNQETALPAGRLMGERGRTVGQLRLFASVVRDGSWRDLRIDPALPDRTPAPRPDLRQMQIPLGPVAIFGASNFPLAFSVAGGDTASALAAGCPVVVKAHPLHPGTSELIGEAITRAATATGMPAGVFSLLQGQTNAVGAALVQDPRITAVGFTGSFRGGKALYDLAVRREVPIPVFAEMGSVNPVFLLPGALEQDVDQLAEGLSNSLNLGVGQFCTNPGLVILPEGPKADRFLEALGGKVRGCTAGTMLSEGIAGAYRSGVERLLAHPAVTQLETSQSAGAGRATSYVFTTTTDAFLADRALEEEVFGPATLVVRAAGPEDFMRIARHLGGHLTASLFGTAAELAEHGELIQLLTRKVGRLIFNAFPTGVEVSHAMVHGGPYPATTAVAVDSVGTAAIRRFSRPVCYQGFPEAALPAALWDGNPRGLVTAGGWGVDTVS